MLQCRAGIWSSLRPDHDIYISLALSSAVLLLFRADQHAAQWIHFHLQALQELCRALLLILCRHYFCISQIKRIR